ncbi:phage shock protein A (IM30), suppresses sigma54-dependent transcription [Lampropedia cohaerens]|uniref:Phage shock protein A (IM30), suppresses sigma54-dependent transcription n=1 Tax=Lampropedia cohaerens TaxID=1610491 RepID=A0A0U1Q273_9BURK|nr:PspA/IM30 family protein [Lampropedia cohaerens]KKW68685.1 phage shock protein A (IM30), suppresses sigma54-dependent transcription [Lampropedia cohaerens]
MSVWNKLITALRGGAHEAGEAIVDSQALRILDQEIRDADADLRKSKEALAEIIAKEKLARGKGEQSAAKIAEYEGYAVRALESGDEALAMEVAGKIAALEQARDEEQTQAQQFAASAAQLRQAIAQAESHIRRLKQQADTVKATENVQRAQATVAERYSGSESRVQTALESLERIKQKQAERGARLQAAAELAQEGSEDALQQRLREAGITPDASSASAVLARLKAQRGAAPAAATGAGADKPV